MTGTPTTAQVIPPPVQLVRLSVDKPQAAVALLHAKSNGVMDLIAHFWERLPQTPPLHRDDLHLVAAISGDSNNNEVDISKLKDELLTGAMLYVPKAHRADVLAMDAATAAAFAGYISKQGGGAAMTGDPGTAAPVAIDFLTGQAEGIHWMVPLLLPLVGKKSPARKLVNVVMQLPPTAACESDANVRIAREADVPTLNRWRRQYKEERGILFDADLDAWVQTGKVFIYEREKQIVSVAKFDLELGRLIEIGGVYTFPEHRNKGYGAKIVADLACRIRATGKTPTLQVDESNLPALKLYENAGWRDMGKLARVWLTG